MNVLSDKYAVGISLDDSEEVEIDGALTIEIISNKILFYGDITESNMLQLNKNLFILDAKLQRLKHSLDGYEPVIELHLNTFGGSVYAALATVDTIRNLKTKVHTYVDGSVASAGTLISIIGEKRFMGSHAYLLIHQLSDGMYGKFQEMADTMYNCTNLMNMLKNYYKKYTKIPMKKFDDLIKKDIWLSAEECLQYGIIDEII